MAGFLLLLVKLVFSLSIGAAAGVLVSFSDYCCSVFLDSFLLLGGYFSTEFRVL